MKKCGICSTYGSEKRHTGLFGKPEGIGSFEIPKLGLYVRII
jgi:hypothetical protein